MAIIMIDNMEVLAGLQVYTQKNCRSLFEILDGVERNNGLRCVEFAHTGLPPVFSPPTVWKMAQAYEVDSKALM